MAASANGGQGPQDREALAQEEALVQEEEKAAVSRTDTWLKRGRFRLGSTTLSWCIALMFLCVLLALWQPGNQLVKSGFDGFRLIVMTILGYVFGTNSKGQ